jgi:hypothetical protein
MNTHCSETTTPPDTTTWRKRRALHLMQRPSNHFSGEKTVEELGWLYLESMQGTISGRLKLKSKRQSYTPEHGRVKVNSRSNPSSPSTGTPTCLWKPVLSTSSTNSLNNLGFHIKATCYDTFLILSAKYLYPKQRSRFTTTPFSCILNQPVSLKKL